MTITTTTEPIICQRIEKQLAIVLFTDYQQYFRVNF